MNLMQCYQFDDKKKLLYNINMKAKLRKAAQKIAELERKCQAGESIEKNMTEIEEISSSFSLEEMAEIDAYITEKDLLTE